MRTFVLTLALLFILMLAVLTVYDVIHYGLSPLDVLAAMVLGLFTFGIVGALRTPPGQ